MKRALQSVFLVCLVSLLCTGAYAGPYTYTLIAQTGGEFTNLGSSAALNNLGTVAFSGVTTDAGAGIYAGGGGPVTVIANTNSFSFPSFGPLPGIDDYGSVAFEANYTSYCNNGSGYKFGYSGIFTGTGTNDIQGAYSGQTQAGDCEGGETYPYFQAFGNPVINNSGTVAFSVYVNCCSGSPGPYNPDLVEGKLGYGGSLYPSTGIDGIGAYGVLNNAGLVAFSDGTTVYTGNGGPLNIIGSGVSPALNDAGTVAFLTMSPAVVVGNGGPLTTIADTSGAYSNFGVVVNTGSGTYISGNAVSINNSGSVAFLANLRSGGNGIFTGPNAVANRVIAAGDALFGSTVSNVAFSANQLSFYGAVSFSAVLADGRTVIARADPAALQPPGPAALNLVSNNVLLSFPTLSNYLYEIQSTPDLVSGVWSTIASNLPGVGGVLTYSDPISQVSQRFYRAATTGVHVRVPIFDNTADAQYSNGWFSSENGGTGFGSWTLQPPSVVGNTNDGYFLGSSTNNAFGAPPGIDVKGISWGMYANGSNYATAFRGFSSLTIGSTFKVDMDNGFIDSGNSDGFVLRNGNANGSYSNYNTNARFEFLFLGGGDSYAVVDAGGYNPIGVPFTGTGLHLVFTLGTNDTYTFQVIDNATGNTDTNITGTLSGAPASTIDSIALYNRNAGAGPLNDAFFNSLQIIGP